MNNYQRNDRRNGQGGGQWYGQQNGQGGGNKGDKPAKNYAISGRFKSEWITTGVNDACMELCEELAKDMVDKKVSSSFLRNIFGELRRLEAGDFENHRSEFVMLRPKMAYACGRAIERNPKSKGVLDALLEFYKQMAKEVETTAHFKNLVSVMEAIVAFHKAFGGSSK